MYKCLLIKFPKITHRNEFKWNNILHIILKKKLVARINIIESIKINFDDLFFN